MKISYINGFGNKGNTFVAQDISTDSLPHQANTNNIHQYLTSDYFLPSSSNAHYYSRKYCGILNLNLKSRIKQVATVSLIFLSMITGEVFAGDKRPKSKASSGRKQEVTFEAITLSNNLPDVVPQLPLPDLIPSNPSVTPPPPPPLPDIVPPVILPDVVPVPPAPPVPPMAPNMPDLVSDAGSSKSDKKSALLQSIRDFGGKIFKLKKVKQEPKLVVVLSSDQDLMSQLHNTLERRRKGVAGEEENNKLKQAAKQVIVLTAEEQARKKAENLARAEAIREQNKKKWEEAVKKNEEIARERRRAEAESVKARIEQKPEKMVVIAMP